MERNETQPPHWSLVTGRRSMEGDVPWKETFHGTSLHWSLVIRKN
ncbi:hypothetical protein [Dactylococcopsis salina]|nr:hypothetical protein [Dactylococcopsis salina]